MSREGDGFSTRAGDGTCEGMIGGDPLNEAVQRLAGFEGDAAKARLPMQVRNPRLVAADIRAVLAELRRLHAETIERRANAVKLAEAFTHAVANLDADEFASVPSAVRAQLSEAFAWLTDRLTNLSRETVEDAGQAASTE